MKASHSSRSALVFGALVWLLIGAPCLEGAEVKGIVADTSGKPVSGARIAAMNAVGIIAEQITGDRGEFDFNVSPLYENVQLRVTASGFQTVLVAETVGMIQLQPAPVEESVNAAGSAIDVPPTQRGASTGLITSEDLRERNEASALDLMRELPGMVFAQAGARGSPADLFIRGGSSRDNLVLIDGIPVNGIYAGGGFDFSRIPADFLSEVDVAQGPQSAIYGSYATGGVVSLLTRSPDNGPSIDVLAEGGTHDENRFAIGGSDLTHGWGVAGSLSSLDGDGPVVNSEYRNDNVFLSAEHRWMTQSLFAFGDFDSSRSGEPGPYGSDPLSLFPGIGTVSRSKNDGSTYGLHYQDVFTNTVRLDVTLGLFLNNSLYVQPSGASLGNKDIRPWGDARATWHPLSFWTFAAGFAYDREELKNTDIATTNGYVFPLRRDDEGIYLDNQFSILGKLFLNVGAREEVFGQAFEPGDANESPVRPDFPARTYSRLNPKISGAYILRPGMRLHASWGTGIRPPGGADLAFTNNPDLRPEKTQTYEVGVEERFLNNLASLDVTLFRNRYKDLIVNLGGSLSDISAYQTANIGNSRAEGVEATGRLRPTNWFLITGNYMWLETEVLPVDGGSGLVPQYFYSGQPLLRRPKQSASGVATFHYWRFDGNVIAYLRGRDLDVEPNYGASAGLFWDPGYVNLGLNLNYRVRGNLTAYGTLHNALDRRYEEVFGYPAPLLNFVAGLKWSLTRAR